ncbi:MAG: YihY/virulence factor BrkB family protein [Rubricoccaceae bacterium]
MSFLQHARALATETVRESLSDDVPSMSAAIAYYTIFSLPPLLVLTLALAGAVFGGEAVRDALFGQVDDLIGPDGAEAIAAMLENTDAVAGGIGARIAGVAILLFGASGAFGQLQTALNRAWEVEGGRGEGLKAVIVKRLFSFGMVLTIGFLLLVSLAVSAVLSALGNATEAVAPSELVRFGLQVANFVVSIGVITLLFALLFRYLPDVRIAWRDVWVGALVTALLFTIGKSLIGLYLGTANPGSAFGAAGSLALILIWIYYSALIVLVGAEFTQAWSARFGSGPIGEAGGKATAAGDRVHPLARPRPPARY